MSNELTIVVPTHNRHPLLERVLPYLIDLGFPLLIIDSTQTPHQEAASDPKVDYVHCPELSLLPKMQKYILERVKSPYMLLNADDMFPSMNGIEEALVLLKSAPCYSAVQGGSLGHSNGKIIYAHSRDHHLFPTDSDRASARLLQHFASYCPIVYSVQRTNCWRETLTRLPKELVNYNYLEFYFCMMFLVHGKVARLPGFAHITDLVPSINFDSKKYRGSTKDFRSDSRFYPELMGLKATVSRYLAEVDGLTYKTAFRYVEGALDMYMARILPSKDYYWLRNKPPKTVRDRLRREWAGIKNKTFGKQQKQAYEQAAKAAKDRREEEAVQASIMGRYDEYQRILDILGTRK